MYRFRMIAAILLASAGVRAQTLDTLVFGNSASESAHNLSTGWGPVTPNSWVDANNGVYPSDPSLTPPSDVVTGGLGQTARRLLPRTPNACVYGGETNFIMGIDPERQNHLTIKLWGSDPSSGIWFVLNVDGKELGLRHGGDSAAPDMLFGNKQIVTFAPNQWVYRTLALPIHLTKGKTSVSLTIRSMGWISDYDSGPFFGDYNKLMNSPSLGLYRIYTHLGSKLDTSGEANGAGFTPASPRNLENETTVINNIKSAINNRISSWLSAPASSRKPLELAWLASCYDAKENLGETWINYGASHTSSTLIQKVIDGIDYHVGRQAVDAGYFNSFGNDSWGGGFGGLGDAIRLIWPQINSGGTMSSTVAYGGSYGSITRTAAWSRALRVSVDFGRFNRRSGQYCNQDVIGVNNTYRANRGLLLVDPANSLLETEAQRYLKEACGLLPYAGSDQSGGGAVPVKGTYPYGNTYFEVTPDGTTKDGGGFVGSDYGEMGSEAVRWGIASGNNDILNRGLQMLRARAIFRFPNFDDQGFRMMQGANPIGVRNRTLPGHYGYMERGNGGVDVAALGSSVIGADLTGYFQNGINEGQQLRLMVGSYDPYLPRNWNLAKAETATLQPVPMSPGAPDFAFVDEDNMVVAAKSGENRIFANLCWASPDHINGWAKIFHLPANASPEYSEVQVDDVRYRPTGTFKTLGRRVEASTRQPFDNPESAYNGVVVPKAWRSDLASIPSDNVDAGKATGYTLRYGHWLIGINAHHSDTYDVILPSNFSAALPITDLVTGNTITGNAVTLTPKTSAVFYLPDLVDPSPRPSRPLVLTANSTATTVVLDWDDASGAGIYQVKRSTTSGSGYVIVGTSQTSSYVDATATSGVTYFYTVSATNDGGEGGNSPEVSISLKAAGPVNRATGGTSAASLSAGTYPPANAFDGSNSSKWNSGATGVAAWLQYDFGTNITWAVTRYDITSADTTNRDPKDWTFEGSIDGVNWTVLDTRTNQTFSSRGQTRQFTLPNSTGFRFHRLNVSAASGGLGYEIQLAELGLVASDPGTVPLLPAPDGLVAVSGDNQVFLTWQALAGADHYVVKRGDSPSGPFVSIGVTENLHFLDDSAPSAGTWHYIVAPVNNGGEGVASASVSGNFSPFTPAPPANPAVSNGPNSGNATISWDASPGVPSYTVKRSATSGGPYTAIATGISDLRFTDSGLTNGSTYHYVITASLSGSESAASTEVSITPQSFAWTGGSANWSVGSNWNGTAPGNGSLLIFSGAPATTTTSNNISNLTLSGIIFNSGAASFTHAGNPISLDGNIINLSANPQTINLAMTLAGNTMIDVGAGQLILGGVITDGSNSYGLLKEGPGLLALRGVNTFDGGLVINSGTVGSARNSGSNTNLGSAAVTVNQGGTLRLGHSVTSNTNSSTTPNDVILAGGSLFADDAFQHLTGTLNVTVGGSLGSTYNAGTNSTGERDKGLFLDGVVTGSGNLNLLQTRISTGSNYNTSIVHFNNDANTYSGEITIIPMSGTAGGSYLGVGAPNALKHATVILDGNNSSSHLRFGDSPLCFRSGLATANIGALSGSGDIVLTTYDMVNHAYANQAITLTVGESGRSTGFTGSISGLGGLVKQGACTFAITGEFEYAGSTTVNGGTLRIESPLLGTGGVIVNQNATLEADSDIAGALVVNSGGIISPGGLETGVLRPNGLDLTAGAILRFDLGDFTTSDLIELSGGTFTAPPSGQAEIQIAAILGFGPGTYPLVSGAPGINASQFQISTTAPAGYTFALSASNGTLSVTVTGPPPAPELLLAYGKNHSVSLVWNDAPGAATYTVYQSTLPDSGFVAVTSGTALSYNATTLTNGTPYYYHVTATNGFGESQRSETVTATPNPNTWAASPISLDWSLASNWNGAAPIDNAQLSFGSSNATNLNNNIEGLTLGGLVFNSGASAFTLSGNPVLLSGNITNQSTAAQTIQLQMTLVGDRTLTTNTGAVTINGSIDDGGASHGLIKAGNGTLTLNGTNSFTGGITVDAGTIVLSGISPTGGGEPIILNNGSTLHLAGTTVTNDIIVPVGATVNLYKTVGTNVVNGRLTGGGSINESTGSGTFPAIHWNNDNSGFTGSIVSNGGSSHRWRFNTPEAGSASAAWILNSTATDAYGFNFGSNSTISFGALSGSGYFRNNGNGSATMRIGDLGTHTTMSGTTMFAIGILKAGAGTLTLSGSGFFHSNPTTVSAGTLNVTGAIATSPVTVENAATLSGTGSLGGTVTLNSGGNLSPGNGGAGATGNLTLNHTFIPKAGSNLRFEVGTSSDQITLGLTSGFTAPGSGTAVIHISAASGFAAGTYTLINNLGGGALTSQAFSIGSLPADYAATLAVNNNSLEITLRFAGADWSGNTSGLWSIASNWNGIIPIDGDKIGFTNSVHTSLTNDLSNLLLRGITFNSGASAFSISGNSIRLGGDIANNSSAGQTLGFPIILTSNISFISNTGPIMLGGVISESGGSFSITKAGSGPLTLSGANTFSGGFNTTAGDTYISGLGSGTPGAPTSGALGTGIVTLAGGRIIYNNGVTALYNNLIAQAGTTTTFLEAVSQPLYLYGNLSGSGNIILDANTNYNGIRLAGDNSAFTGTVTLNSTGNSARHKFESASAGSASAMWIFNGPTDSGSMNFGTGTIHFGEFSGNANQIRNNSTGTATLSVGALDTDSSFTGVISSVGSLALRKVGTGTLTLSGTNTYTGSTTIESGTLKFTGNKTGTGAVTIGSGGTLAGTATIAGPVMLENEGSIAPGNNGAGTLTLSGTVAFNNGGVLNLDLATPATSDKLALTGSTFTGPSSGTVTLNLSPLTGFAPGIYPLITGANAINASGFSIGSAPGGYVYLLGTSADTLNLTIIEAVIPDAPTNLTATGGSQAISLQWSPVSGADTYSVKRAEQPGGPYVVISSGLISTAFVDSTLTNGVTRHYVVSATNIAGESADSNEASATTHSAIETWRFTHFGSTGNAGNAADSADPDHDGRSNLIEYATGTLPLVSNPGNPATLTRSADGLRLVLQFNRIADPALIYQVEAADDAAVWTSIWSATGAANTAGPVEVTDTELISSHPKRFLRLSVSR